MRLLILLLLMGCSHTSYRNGPVHVERWAFGSDIDLKPISDTSDKFGNHSVKIKGLDSNQSEAVGKAVEGAVTAIMKGAP